jgi:hypothetical protein
MISTQNCFRVVRGRPDGSFRSGHIALLAELRIKPSVA